MFIYMCYAVICIFSYFKHLFEKQNDEKFDGNPLYVFQKYYG